MTLRSLGFHGYIKLKFRAVDILVRILLLFIKNFITLLNKYL